MKTTSISFSKFYLLLFFFSLFSCNTDDNSVSEPSNNSLPTLVSVDEVLAKIKSAKIKNTINNIVNLKKKSKINEFENPEYFEKVILTGHYEQYSLYLNKYNTNRPYFLYYIITIDKNSNEKSGYLKYIPDTPTSEINLRSYSGILQLLNDDMIIQAQATLQNGQIIANSFGTTNCVQSIVRITHNCTNGGEHSPEESCSGDLQNDAYYSFSIFLDCYTNFDYSSPGDFIGGGGGGIISNIDRFNDSLTLQQQNFLNSKPNIKDVIYTYIERTAIISNAILMIDIGIRDIDLLNVIINEMVTNNFSRSSTRFASWATGYLTDNPNVTLQQFNNWFMGEVEGIESTESYIGGYWDNPNLIIPQQQLPTKANFLAAYPMGSASQVSNLIGGEILTLYNAIIATGKNMNTCAIRLSRALNYSGVVIPNIPGKTKLGADGKYYFTFAADITAWMMFTFGINNGDGVLIPINSNHVYLEDGGINGVNFATQLENTTGIYSMQPINVQLFGATGHCDAIVNGICQGNKCYYRHAIGVHIWILQ